MTWSQTSIWRQTNGHDVTTFCKVSEGFRKRAVPSAGVSSPSSEADMLTYSGHICSIKALHPDSGFVLICSGYICFRHELLNWQRFALVEGMFLFLQLCKHFLYKWTKEWGKTEILMYIKWFWRGFYCVGRIQAQPKFCWSMKISRLLSFVCGAAALPIVLTQMVFPCLITVTQLFSWQILWALIIRFMTNYPCAQCCVFRG